MAGHDQGHEEEVTAGRFADAIRARFDGHVSGARAHASRALLFERLRHRRARRVPRVALATVGAALCGAMFAVWLSWPRAQEQQTLTVESEHLTLSADGAFAAARQGMLQFSDGSRVVAAAGATGTVERLDGAGADVRVTSGHIDVDVAKRSTTRWNVSAGPYRVRVTGTRFAIDWEPRTRRFFISMQEGRVVVAGPEVGERVLAAGQSLLLEPPREPPREPEPRAVAATADAPLEQPLPAPGPERSSARSHAPARAAAPPLASRWPVLVAEGKYDEVLSQADGPRLAVVLRKGSLDQLAALADAARYTGRRRVAGQALQAQRDRFPDSQQAAMAAFLLGRIAEDGGDLSQAVRWYDRYLAASGPQTLAEESLGRKMLVLERASRAAEAKNAAAAYLQRFAKGSFAGAARRLLAQP